MDATKWEWKMVSHSRCVFISPCFAPVRSQYKLRNAPVGSFYLADLRLPEEKKQGLGAKKKTSKRWTQSSTDTQTQCHIMGRKANCPKHIHIHKQKTTFRFSVRQTKGYWLRCGCWALVCICVCLFVGYEKKNTHRHTNVNNSLPPKKDSDCTKNLWFVVVVGGCCRCLKYDELLLCGI